MFWKLMKIMELHTPTRLPGWRTFTSTSQPQETESCWGLECQRAVSRAGTGCAVGQGTVKPLTTLFYTGKAKNLLIPFKIISRITQVWKLFSLVLPLSLCTSDDYMLKWIQPLLFMWEGWSMFHKCYNVFCTGRTVNRYKSCLLIIATSSYFSSEENQNDDQVINYLCLYIVFPIIFDLIQLNYDSVDF